MSYVGLSCLLSAFERYQITIQGGSKKVSCCTVSADYFFEPPCISINQSIVDLYSA